MNIQVLFITLFIAFIIGLVPILDKILLKTLSPYTVLAGSGIIYILCMIAFLYYYRETIRKDIKKLNYLHILLFAFIAIVGSFIIKILFLNVLKNHHSHIITALVYSAPFFTLLMAYFFLKEDINIYGLIGVLFIILGVVFIAFNNGNKSKNNIVKLTSNKVSNIIENK
jgi:drug/metabolite transporter (DMT)-like permease